MCCWPFVDVVLEDPPPKEAPKEYTMVSDKLNLVEVSRYFFVC